MANDPFGPNGPGKPEGPPPYPVDPTQITILEQYLRGYHQSVIGVYLRTHEFEELLNLIQEAKERLKTIKPPTGAKGGGVSRGCPAGTVPCNFNECCEINEGETLSKSLEQSREDAAGKS